MRRGRAGRRPHRLWALALALVAAAGCAGCAARSAFHDSAASTAPADNGGVFATTEQSLDLGQMQYSLPEVGEAAAEQGLGAGGLAAPADGRRVTYSARARLETKEFDAALAALLAGVEQAGGYVASRSVEGYDTRTAWLQLCIPSAALDTFLSQLSGQANVVSISQSQEDITDSYLETQSWLASLTTQQERLLELMAQADTLEALLEIEDRLAQVRAQLQYYDSRKAAYDTRIAYAQVDVDLYEVRDYTVAQPSFGQRVAGALGDTWRGFVDFLQGLVLVLIHAAPYLVLLALVCLPLVWLCRRRRAARRAATAGTVPAPQPGPAAHEASAGQDETK